MKKLTITEIIAIKKRALQKSKQYEIALLLDNSFCENAFGIRHIEFIMALGCSHEIKIESNSFDALGKFVEQHKDKYVFSWLCYDLKNELEKLTSNNEDKISFDPCYAFVPEKLIVINSANECVVGEELLDTFFECEETPSQSISNVLIEAKNSKDDYLKNIVHIKKQIIDGNVYELNYCTEFFAAGADIIPEHVYQNLISRSPVPFAAYVKHNGKYLMCASPERFITKNNGRVYSQPIKGTAPRSDNEKLDLSNRQQLLESEKERAENLMIVDLVRNDLAKTAVTGSIQVEELFGLYAFPQVHQMISTVSSNPSVEFTNVEVIREAFPMGSMTGAPKIRAMQIIEEMETTKRGLYSGAVGYFSPEGEFDFNVVIRSIQYNSATKYLNFEVGSAITFDSVAEQEYEECLLKAKAIMEVLKGG